MIAERTWRKLQSMSQPPQKLLRTNTSVLILLTLVFLALHVATSGQYGFHRDELATLDDARHLEWGFVAYPPLTPAIGRIALSLFGISQIGIRLFPILALSAALLLSGLMARELGGNRRAQILTALAVAIVPIVNIQSSLLQYVSFDYLWGVLLTYFLIRLVTSENPRWWIAIGAVIGLGMMTKYTMAFFAVSLVGAIILTPIRRHLLSPWLWMGLAVSLLIFMPNLIWQWRHGFISIEFLRHIHARDVRWGRAKGFLPEQLFVCNNVLLLPLSLMGLWFFCRERKYRLLGWMFILTFALFFIAKARSYYLGPLYPMLIAAGSVMWERRTSSSHAGTAAPGCPAEQSSAVNKSRPKRSRLIQAVTWTLVLLGAISSFALFVPIAPINSALWNTTAKLQDNFKEEIGWTDLVATVAGVYDSVPANERARTGILAGNYGEAGAINLFGPNYKLPPAISGTNSAWYRSYPQGQPQTLIAVGLDDDFLKEHFGSCELVAHNTNPYGVINEESRYHPGIYLCHHLLQPWPEFWPHFQRFG
jgi:4-amino-4-deoxy-L-arabinose transferase-like glycosyltransferase